MKNSEKKKIGRPRKEVVATPEKVEFAKRLVMLREKIGLTPSECAKAVGVCTRTYSYWEAGRGNVPFLAGKKLVHLFGLQSLEDLFPPEK